MMEADPTCWSREIRLTGSGQRLMSLAFDLLQRLIDKALVVFGGQVPLDDLRGDHHRQLDRFATNVFERTARLELNLPLRVLHDVIGFGARLGADLFT